MFFSHIMHLLLLRHDPHIHSALFNKQLNIVLPKLSTSNKWALCLLLALCHRGKCLWARSSSFTPNQRQHLVWLQAAAYTYRLPSQPASFKVNRQNCEIRRDKEAKSHFHSSVRSNALVKKKKRGNNQLVFTAMFVQFKPASKQSSVEGDEFKCLNNYFDFCMNSTGSDAATAVIIWRYVWTFQEAQQLPKEQIFPLQCQKPKLCWWFIPPTPISCLVYSFYQTLSMKWSFILSGWYLQTVSHLKSQPCSLVQI